jgi:hypothetical protein
MSPRALDELKQQIPLLEYLQSREWRPVRALRGGRWLGLCPLHTDHKPSFLVDPQKSLFYCYGCGRGYGAYGKGCVGASRGGSSLISHHLLKSLVMSIYAYALAILSPVQRARLHAPAAGGPVPGRLQTQSARTSRVAVGWNRCLDRLDSELR